MARIHWKIALEKLCMSRNSTEAIKLNDTPDSPVCFKYDYTHIDVKGGVRVFEFNPFTKKDIPDNQVIVWVAPDVYDKSKGVYEFVNISDIDSMIKIEKVISRLYKKMQTPA